MVVVAWECSVLDYGYIDLDQVSLFLILYYGYTENLCHLVRLLLIDCLMHPRSKLSLEVRCFHWLLDNGAGWKAIVLKKFSVFLGFDSSIDLWVGDIE